MLDVLHHTDSLGNFQGKKQVFSLRREQVWTFSALGDRIYKMRCLFVAVGPNVLFCSAASLG